MVKRKCSYDGCSTDASYAYGLEGSKTAKYCARHAANGMINVYSKKRCRHPLYHSSVFRGGKAAASQSSAANTRRMGWSTSSAIGDGAKNQVATRKRTSARQATPARRNSVPSTLGGMVNTRSGTINRNKSCEDPGCTSGATYGMDPTKKPQFCSRHKTDGMVNLSRKRCSYSGCTIRATYGVDGSKKGEFCSVHARDGMVDVTSTRCNQPGCRTQPMFGIAGEKAEFCVRHMKDGMINIRSNTCGHPDCTTRASYGKDDHIKKAEFCARHAQVGMIHVRAKTCDHVGCTTRANFGVPGSKKAEFCSRHAEDGMVDLGRNTCGRFGCLRTPSYGVEGSQKRDFCQRHAKAGMVNVKTKGGSKRPKPSSGIHRAVKQELRDQYVSGSTSTAGTSGRDSLGVAKQPRTTASGDPAEEMTAAAGPFMGFGRRCS